MCTDRSEPISTPAADNPDEFYSPRNWWKPELRIEGDCVVKDYRRNAFPARWFGRFCLHCEEVALRRLAGVEGVPVFVGRPTPYVLHISLVPGVPLARKQPGQVSQVFLQNLTALFDRIHERGVAHGDAHKRNILVDGDNAYLIDFSTAHVQGRFPVLDNWVFSCVTLLDRERLYKVEKKFFGTGTPPRMFWLYRAAKAFRRKKR